jgi:hypothetical protein
MGPMLGPPILPDAERSPRRRIEPMEVAAQQEREKTVRQRALTYKAGSTAASHVYLGKMEFASRLITNHSNSYMHDGRWEVVQIDRIEPATWSPNSEIVPTVFVSDQHGSE